ncbi:hypothetical protein EKH55_1496 [Sinorhizobium alkalisoli]|nr:hypothetical protein EKH55_1496 [Sinorhizobium alkalisoli]
MKNDPKHLAKFNVIEGGGLRSPSWLALPSTVIGRSIRDRNLSEVYR